MSEQTLKFNDVVVDQKEFHASKQAIALNVVGIDKIVVSDKLNTVIMVLSTLLVIQMMMMMISLDLCVLCYFN